MKVIADLAIIPIGVGVSLSKYVAACERVLTEAGLEPKLHANGTNVQGDWDVVFAALNCSIRSSLSGSSSTNTMPRSHPTLPVSSRTTCSPSVKPDC